MVLWGVLWGPPFAGRFSRPGDWNCQVIQRLALAGLRSAALVWCAGFWCSGGVLWGPPCAGPLSGPVTGTGGLYRDWAWLGWARLRWFGALGFGAPGGALGTSVCWSAEGSQLQARAGRPEVLVFADIELCWAELGCDSVWAGFGWPGGARVNLLRVARFQLTVVQFAPAPSLFLLAHRPRGPSDSPTEHRRAKTPTYAPPNSRIPKQNLQF